MSVKITKVDSYSTYGRCLKIANGSVEILVTTDVGPRIISLCAPGDENLFFNDAEDVRVVKGPGMDAYFGKGAEYHFYGGHRMWMAPQHDIKTDIPDNFPVNVELIENGAVFTPPANDYIGERSWMKIVMDPEKPQITVDCTFKNIGAAPLRMAVWQVSQMAPGGLEIVPLPCKMPKFPFKRPAPGTPMPPMPIPGPDDYIKPDRILALFAITNLQDPRLYIDNSFLTLRHDAQIRRPFKIGLANYEGWAMYINKGKVVKFNHKHDKSLTYTDGGSSLETYTDATFTEVETLGEYKELKPGDEITSTETITICDAVLPTPDSRDNAALEAFVKAHL